MLWNRERTQKKSKKFFNTDGFHAVHIHLNIIVLSPLTWNIITSKDFFWGLCYHNHVRKPSIYSQQRSSFKRSKRRGQAWANSSALRGGVAVHVPCGWDHITCRCGSVDSRRKTEWLMRNLQQGRLFSLPQTLYRLSSIPVDTTELCFPMDALIKPSTLGGRSKETLDGRQCCFYTRLTKVCGKSWQTPWQLIAWKRSQCTYVQSVQATAEEWLIRCAFQLFTTTPVDLLCHRSNTQTILAGG